MNDFLLTIEQACLKGLGEKRAASADIVSEYENERMRKKERKGKTRLGANNKSIFSLISSSSDSFSIPPSIPVFCHLKLELFWLPECMFNLPFR